MSSDPALERRALDERRELLARALQVSGLSARRFAVELVYRHERTMRRWMAGDTAVPDALLPRLREIIDGRAVPTPSPTR